MKIQRRYYVWQCGDGLYEARYVMTDAAGQEHQAGKSVHTSYSAAQWAGVGWAADCA